MLLRRNVLRFQLMKAVDKAEILGSSEFANSIMKLQHLRGHRKSLGKSAVVREREESKTLPRKSFFGKDIDERSRIFNVLQALSSSSEILFSGKLLCTAIAERWRASP
jgi:hypothetical protein